MGVPEKSVAALINANFKAMKSVLPKHMTAERMARIALIEVRRNPKLGQSDPGTLIGAILVASQLGLEPGLQGMGYLIPYYNKNRGCYEVQFQIGYRGMMDLARRSGGVGMITAEAVRENDDFWYRLGTDQKIHHVPASGERGRITHFYSVAKLIPSDHMQIRVMEVSEVEKIRDVHSKANAGGFSPWRDHFEEMGLKTLIRRNCKYLPTSPEMQKAVSLDEMADAGVAQNLAAELPLDMEVPAEFETATDKTAPVAEQLKKDLAAKVADTPADDPGPQEEPPQDDDGDLIPEPDDFDVMDSDALNTFLTGKLDGASAATKSTIKSAIETDNLKLKREFARRLI